MKRRRYAKVGSDAMIDSREYDIAGWIVERNPLYFNGAYLWAAHCLAGSKGFDKFRDAKAYCLAHPDGDAQ